MIRIDVAGWIFLVALMTGGTASTVFAQDTPASDEAARQEAVERVRETLQRIQSLEGAEIPAAPADTAAEAADGNPAEKQAEPAKPPAVKGTGKRIPFFPTQTEHNLPPNTVSPGVSKEAKRNFYQSAMLASPISFRDMVSIMANKKRVADGVSFDDAVEAMLFRANEVNFKHVGTNKLWLDVRAISGDENTPRVEIFQFCDAMVARRILDYAPEFAIFIPCRIALIEDGDGALWVMTMDWDVTWLDYAQNPNSELEQELRKEAVRIRDAIEYIMEGGATGDF